MSDRMVVALADKVALLECSIRVARARLNWILGYAQSTKQPSLEANARRALDALKDT